MWANEKNRSEVIEDAVDNGFLHPVEINYLKVRSKILNNFERFSKIPFNEKLDSSKYECLIIEDLSCFPDFNLNDIIIYNIEIPENINNDKLVILNYDNNFILRKFYRDGDRIIYKAINPTYPDIIQELDQKSLIVGISYCSINNI